MRVLRVLAAAAALLASPAAADAQTAGQLFDPRTLQDIQLFINTRDLQTLRAHYTEDRYYAADFQWRGIRIRNLRPNERASSASAVLSWLNSCTLAAS